MHAFGVERRRHLDLRRGLFGRFQDHRRQDRHAPAGDRHRRRRRSWRHHRGSRRSGRPRQRGRLAGRGRCGRSGCRRQWRPRDGRYRSGGRRWKRRDTGATGGAGGGGGIGDRRRLGSPRHRRQPPRRAPRARAPVATPPPAPRVRARAATPPLARPAQARAARPRPDDRSGTGGAADGRHDRHRNGWRTARAPERRHRRLGDGGRIRHGSWWSSRTRRDRRSRRQRSWNGRNRGRRQQRWLQLRHGRSVPHGSRLDVAPRSVCAAREAETGRLGNRFVASAAVAGGPAQASAPVTTVPVATSLEMIAGDTPTAASIVRPNAARLFTGETSPLADAAPDLESIASAP